MRKAGLVLLGAAVFLAVGSEGLKLGLAGPLSGVCKDPRPLLWGIRPAFIDSTCKQVEDSWRAKTTRLCNWKSHSCKAVQPGSDTGELKIKITVGGKPGKNIEVDLWTSSRPGGTDESYVVYTDGNGLAWFRGIPPGVYYPANNLSGFPKEYGDAYLSWGTQPTKVTKGQTGEVTIALTGSRSSPGQEGCTFPISDDKGRGGLRVKITAGGSPVKRLEVDLHGPTSLPPVCHVLTNDNGVVFFEKIPVGDYRVGFNSLNFPKEFGEVGGKGMGVKVRQNQTTEETIELLPKK